MPKLKTISGAAILILALIVALNPNVAYAPTPRVILYFLMSVFPAIIFAGELQAKFEFTVGKFVAAGSGVFAAMLILLLTLDYLTKVELPVTVYEVVRADDNTKPYAIDGPGAVMVESDSKGRSATVFTKANQLLVIFHKESPKAYLKIRGPDGAMQSLPVVYSGSHEKPSLEIK